MRRRLVPGALALTLCLLAACGDTDQGLTATRSDSAGAAADPGSQSTDGSSTDDTTDDTDGTDDTATDGTTNDDAGNVDQDAAFHWQDYLGDGSVDIGSFEVPVDYDDPDGPTFTLAIARHNADPDERIGSLLVNRGGPGFPSTEFAIYADQIYSADLVEHFDIISWDPRGTGESTPAIDCVDDYDTYFAEPDITPDDDAEREAIVDLSKEFQEDCAEKNADIIQHIGTNDTARDMDSIRRALGEQTISYFGFSYGSELGATWATLFPDTVRAAVLDGASDPNADFVTDSLQQTKGFEDSIDTFLARCSDDSSCPFHHDGDSEGAFDALMASLDEKPVPSEPGRPDVNLGVALTAVTEAMYSEASWPQLEQALADAEDGDGAGLLALYDEYFQRRPDGTYDNSLEAFQSISCMDDPERLTVEEADATVPEFQEVAPRLSPGTTGPYFCSFFPPTDDPRVTITGAGAGPILVVGTTGDPATPLSSTENMAKALEGGVLLTVTADQHTGYTTGPCPQKIVDDYLIDLTVPDTGARCD